MKQLFQIVVDVKGTYEFTVSKAKTAVAVKIVDTLGEEVLVTKEV